MDTYRWHVMRNLPAATPRVFTDAQGFAAWTYATELARGYGEAVVVDAHNGHTYVLRGLLD